MSIKRKSAESTLEEVNIKGLNSEELELFVNNYGTVARFLNDDTSDLNLKSVMFPAEAVFFKQTSSTTSVIRTPNATVGDVLLLPTSDLQLEELNFAYARIDSITVMGDQVKHFSITFTVIGHMGKWNKNYGDACFGELDRTYTSSVLPKIIMVPIKVAADKKLKEHQERAELTQPKGKPKTFTQGKICFSKVGNNSSAYFGQDESGSSDQSTSKSIDSKIYTDEDGTDHQLDSKLATSFSRTNKTWWRIMSETKYNLLIKNMLNYDSVLWDERELPFKNGKGSESTDPEIASLGNIFLLSEMSINQDQEKIDKARQMLFRVDDWKWLSIVDFKLEPSSQSLKEFGHSRGGRLFLIDCIEGVLTFIRVYFYHEAHNLLQRTIKFLSTELTHQRNYYDFNFLRAKIEAVFANFFTSVRNSKTFDILYPSRVFSNKGDVWKLFDDYENSMFEEIHRDVFPHGMFNAKLGEFSRIVGGGFNQFNKGLTAKPVKVIKSLDICGFFLRYSLGMSHPKFGTPYKECLFGDTCSFTHTELSTISVNQAKELAKTLDDPASVIAAIDNNVSLFKE